MKRIFSLLLILLLVAASGLAVNAQSETKEIKILCIGDSTSLDETQYLYSVLENCGVKSVIGNVYLEEADLEAHANSLKKSVKYRYRKATSSKWESKDDSSVTEALNDEAWDIVTVQQSMEFCGDAQNYKILNQVIGLIKQRAPHVKVMWQMNWAYQANADNDVFVKEYGSNQEEMYNSIVDVVKNTVVVNGNISGVIPTGTAVQNMRTSFVGDNLTLNGANLTYTLGRYVAAVCFARGLGVNIDKLSYKPFSDMDYYLPIVVESANNAADNPYSITKSIHSKRPANIPEIKEDDDLPPSVGIQQGAVSSSPSVTKPSDDKSKLNHSPIPDNTASQGGSVIQKELNDTTVIKGNILEGKDWIILVVAAGVAVLTVAVTVTVILVINKKKNKM